MLKTRTNTEDKIGNKEVPENVVSCLLSNKEALIITARDTQINGETDIAVYTKFLDKDSIITPIISDILKNLITNIKLNE